SRWHVERTNRCFYKVWRKSRAIVREVIWEIRVSGGTIGERFLASSGSEVNLFGKQFFLNGVDLSSFLVPGQSFVITDRNVPLIGVLADGTPFDFLLASSGGRTPTTDVFQTSSTLSVTLVIPEPASFLLMMMSFAGLSLRSSRLPASGGRKSPA
ncbi:MAG: PEP-CTERM sorting domain-containing protein, partial [Bythopirellula sp.]|nr:PEP-CTERM sorting domain-containing protein [Bythopirellula sp.]